MITNNQNKKNYGDYSFEDFLDDDYFVSSILNPTDDNISFWAKMQEEYPIIKGDFAKAVRHIELIGTLTDSTGLEKTEKGAIWSSIANVTMKAKHRKRRWLVSSVGIASCVIFGLLLGNYIKLHTNTGEKELMDIVLFAEKSAVTPYKVNTTVLMLSDNNKVEIGGRESVISYNTMDVYVDKIKVNHMIAKGSYNQVIVPKGRRSFVAFEDGTMVWVNGGTVLLYPSAFQQYKREIYIDGEIFLDVAKNTEKPFIVRTRDMRIEVKGTKFVVSAYNSEDIASVVLVEGSVLVKYGETPSEYMLKPNEIFESVAGDTSVRQVDVTGYVSWVDGYYKYEREYLANVVTHLAKYYDKTIVCDDKAKTLVCSGKIYIHEDFNMLLEGLSEALPISVEQRGEIYYIFHK